MERVPSSLVAVTLAAPKTMPSILEPTDSDVTAAATNFARHL
jgi:hypothetical protein